VLLDSGRCHTIGRYGDITLAKARSAAQRLRAEKTLGRLFPKYISLTDARAEYLAQLTVRQSTRMYYERTLNRLKSSRLSDITPHDINQILDPMARTSRDQTLAAFRAFFKWSLSRHYIDKSPCELMTLSKTTFRTRVLSDDELSSVWRSCGELGRFGAIVKLLILTGQRRSEIAALKTNYCNFSERALNQSPHPTITLPASLCKNGREHTFPVGETTVSILSPLFGNSQRLHIPCTWSSGSSVQRLE
jgi:integrase